MPPSLLHSALSILNLWFHLWAVSRCCTKCLHSTFQTFCRSLFFIFVLRKLSILKTLQYIVLIPTGLSDHLYKYRSKIHPNIACKSAVMPSACTFSLQWGKVILVILTTYALAYTSSLQAGPERCSLKPSSSSAFWLEWDWSCSTTTCTQPAEKDTGKTSLRSGVPCFKGSIV